MNQMTIVFKPALSLTKPYIIYFMNCKKRTEDEIMKIEDVMKNFAASKWKKTADGMRKIAEVMRRTVDAMRNIELLCNIC